MESGGNDAPAKVEQKEEDILDSWEDCLESLDLYPEVSDADMEVS